SIAQGSGVSGLRGYVPPKSPSGAGACGALTRTFGLTGPEFWPPCSEASPGLGAPRNSSFQAGTEVAPLAAATCENTGTARNPINTKVATMAKRNVVDTPPSR